MGSRHRIPGEILLGPPVLASLAVLVLNDHWLKARFANAMTGKLSDVAGLFFFPLLLVSLAEFVCWAGRRSPWAYQNNELVAAAVGTAVGFAAIKTVRPAGVLYVKSFGAIRWLSETLLGLAVGGNVPPYHDVELTRDATDLLVLPIVLLSYATARVNDRPARRPAWRSPHQR